MRRATRATAVALATLAATLGGLAYADVTGDTSVVVNVRNAFSGTTLGTAKNQFQVSHAVSFAAGTSSGQVNEEWSGSIALASSTPQTLDLTALTGEAGRTVTFSKIKSFTLTNTHATATVTVGNGASNQWVPGLDTQTGTIAVGPGDVIHLTRKGAGFTVDGTHKTLKLDPGASAITVQMVILGNL